MSPRSALYRACRYGLLASLAIVAPVMPLPAQTAYPALADVDPVNALSRYLRMLASNPRDLASLTGAGRAALAVGDANAALGFYARAEELSPRNGRIKAGLATALVQMEQPRVALKLFDEAVALGVPAAEVAADRGLAHDLVGDNRRAQADYTIALRAAENDETVRRLALSMAVSGDRDGALAVLSPLLRRRDSGAERARAFVLALTGDQAGAANSVRTAMPGPQAGAMTGFMTRLAALNPAQKALAVNFGYFPSDGRSYTAAELFADARAAPLPAPGSVMGMRDPRRADTPLIPMGEALGPRLAVNEVVSAAPRRRPGAEEILPPAHVLSAPIPGVTPPPTSMRSPSATVGPSVSVSGTPAGTTPVSAAPYATNGATITAAAVPSYVANTVAPLSAPGAVTAPSTHRPAAIVAPSLPAGGPVVASATTVPAPGFSAGITGAGPAGDAVTAASGVRVAPAGTPAITVTSSGPALVGPTRIATVELPASASAAATQAPATPPVEPVQPLRAPPVAPRVHVEPPRAAASWEPKPAATRAVTPPARKGGETGGRTIGGARQAFAKPAPVMETKRGGKGEVAVGTSKEGDGKGTRLAALDTRDKRPLSVKKGKVAGDVKEARAKDAKDETKTTKATDAKTRAADAKDAKARSARDAKPAKDSPPAKPERYWVQVASGNNKADLDRAWGTVKDKAPRQLSGQTTYTAPWRASNRLLIGPFKTADEAQAKVNALAKSGVSGIQFTTRAGADVEKVAKN